MANATVICGSGDYKGHTANVCRAVTGTLTAKGYAVRTFFPSDMAIIDCDGCDKCAGLGYCRMKDDMRFIYDSFADSDLLIIASPIFFDGLSSSTVRCIGRFQLHWNRKDLHRPSKCIAMYCAGRKDPDISAAEQVMNRFCKSMGIELIDTITVAGTDESPTEETYEKANAAFEKAIAKLA